MIRCSPKMQPQRITKKLVKSENVTVVTADLCTVGNFRCAHSTPLPTAISKSLKLSVSSWSRSEKSLIHFSPPSGLPQSIPGVFVISPHGGPTTINALISNNGIRLQTRSQLTPVFPTTTSIISILAVRFTSLSRIPMTGMTPSPIRTFITTQIRSIPTENFMAV